jgi:predicted nuclease of restriction endonuclease-like (RecB) superfamily
MTNSSHVSCINQHKQIYMDTRIYHVCKTLSNLIIMLKFLVIMEITSFDFRHDGHI